MSPEEIGQVLDEIGERIGPAGSYAWELTVRQVVIDGALWGVFGLLLLFGLVPLTIYAMMRARQNWYDALAVSAWAAIPGVALTILGVTQLLNPEYHAMVRLLDRVLP